MAKSNYPNKLDTSAEIPVVRDNITEIGSDFLNSLRSAIFQIEKTLGVNPQGAVGSSLAFRMSKSLDDNGNIKKTALDRAGVVSGPIVNSSISKNAAIDESKIRLNYPTQLLQDQLSILNTKIKNYINSLEELSSIISAHVHKDAINRHRAKAISVEADDGNASSIATMSLTEGSVQDVLQDIYDSHINFAAPLTLSSLSRAHEADQIFYDNSSNSSIVTQTSVQGAIDDLVEIETVGLRNSNLAFNSNGLIRTAASTDRYEGLQAGAELVASAEAAYGALAGTATTSINFLTPAVEKGKIKRFDVLTLSGSINIEDNRDYIVSSVVYNGDKVASVVVYGGPKFAYATGIKAKVTKNVYNVTNENGLNGTIRPRALQSNTPDVQLALPNSATVISVGIQPEKITSLTRNLDIKIDEESAVTIDLYSTELPLGLDSIVFLINKYAVTNHLNIMAYKVRSLNCYELAISHNLPNSNNDVKNRTIEIKESSNNDCLSALGLTYLKDVKVEGTYGNPYHINGIIHYDFGSIQAFDSSTCDITTGSNSVDIFGDSFISKGIKEGDIVVVTNSTESKDDGTYRIDLVEDNRLTLEDTGYAFAGNLTADKNGTIFVVDSTAHVGDIEFDDATVVTGSIMFDVFITDEMMPHFSKRMDINGGFSSSTFSATIADVSKNFIKVDQSASLTITGGSGVKPYAQLKDTAGLLGESIFVGASGVYKIYASDGLEFILLDVECDPAGELSSTTTVSLKGYSEPERSVYHVCRGIYSTHLGRVLGDSQTGKGIPELIDKRLTGTVDSSIISENFIERYIQGPRNDLRSSGIIQGLKPSNLVDLGSEGFTIDVGAGVFYSNGIRFEHIGTDDMRVPITGNVYIAIDGSGCLVAKEEINDVYSRTEPGGATTKINPFINQDVALVCYVDATTNSIIDLRFFIGRLDDNVNKDIIVSNDPKMGHFTSLNAAVAYAKKGYYMNPNLGTPKIHIREGTYSLSSQIVLDFDVHITGSGVSTILKKTGTIAAGGLTAFDSSTSLFLIGATTNTSSSYISKGITLENFAYESSSSLTSGRSSAIAISQKTNYTSSSSETHSPNAMFRFSNLHFLGNSGVSRSSLEAAPYEYAIFVGGQDSSTLNETDSLKLGNIIITECFFSYMGDERGPVYLATSSSTPNNVLSNIIATNNISINTSPNMSSISGHDLADIGIFSDEGSATKFNVIQSANAISA